MKLFAFEYSNNSEEQNDKYDKQIWDLTIKADELTHGHFACCSEDGKDIFVLDESNIDLADVLFPGLKPIETNETEYDWDYFFG